MKLYIGIISPKLLDFFGLFSPLGVGGIGNMTLAPLIISRDPMSEGDETHEYIHCLQQYELGVVLGALLGPALLLAGLPWWVALVAFVWGLLPGIGWFSIFYGLTYAYWSVIVKKNLDDFDKVTPGQKAYFLIPFEREAYLYDQDGGEYLKVRKWFAWLRIKEAEAEREGAELSEKLYLAYAGNHSLGTIFTKKKDPVEPE